MRLHLFHTTLSSAVFTVAAAFSNWGGAAPAVPCATLSTLDLLDTTITLSQEVTSGSVTVAVPPTFAPRTISGLPPFCRVAGVIKPTSDSNILFEVWLPIESWNGRFAGVGNGTSAGSIIYEPIGTLTDSLAVQLKRGYAVANSDMGHPAGTDPFRFAFDHPEQLVDFGTRATHELTLKGKAITNAYYGKPPTFSYWYGCSTGGRQGLREAQRFPDDYDGIVAGSPANNYSLLPATALDNVIRIQRDPENNIPQAKAVLLAGAVLAACDAKDGIIDGLIDDPRRCQFDPASLQCTANQDTTTCLTAAQVASARSMYEGLIDPSTGEEAYPGRERGSEAFWATFTVGPVNQVMATSYARWVAFGDPNWDWTGFDFQDPADFDAFFANDTRLAPILSAMDPDLRLFRQRGGKLIQYHGWADNNPVAPRSSINYFQNVVSFLGENPQDFYRLFMAPGMTHCSGAQARGPNVFDMMTAIENWVERGFAPTQVVAAHFANGTVDRTRPLCSYPNVARWTGAGSIDDANNFLCSPPVGLHIVPQVINLRADAGLVVAFIHLGGGFDPEGWHVGEVRLEGSPAISTHALPDGRTFMAKFDRRGLSSVAVGDAVTLTLTGTLQKDGGQVEFTAETNARVL